MFSSVCNRVEQRCTATISLDSRLNRVETLCHAWRVFDRRAVSSRSQWAAGSALCCARAEVSYSPFDNIRKPWNRSGASRSQETRGAVKSAETSSGTTHRERPRGSQRPAISSVQRRKEEVKVFPRTLKSGRYAEQHTISQRLHRATDSGAAEEFETNTAAETDAAYAKSAHSSTRSHADSRFFKKVNDYREIQDGDPYASVFGESQATHRLRTRHWQRQFEEENADVELPYERTNVLSRLAPNWFVRYFLNIRDRGGVDHLWFIGACGLFAFVFLVLVLRLFYTAPSQARPIGEVR